jgi:DNA-binding ferritin-like protein (Dps family)
MIMAKNPLEWITGSFDDKKRWKAYKSRAAQLPQDYRAGIDAVERYLLRTGDIPTDSRLMVTMFEDLIDLFEQAAADGVPVRDVVGDEPAEFVETFARTYSDGGWVAKERERLAKSIDTATGEDPQP